MNFLIITSILSIVFIILGILFLNNKGLNLISGYNTMSQEQKERYDEKALLRFMAYLMFAIAGNLMIIVLGMFLNIKMLVIIASFLMSLTSIGIIIYCNTGSRFIKKK